MEKKQLDWANLKFVYQPTDYRFVTNWKNGKWDDGTLTKDPNVVLNECAEVLQYSQSGFEGMKAYTTEDGRTVTFRPDLNAERFETTCKQLMLPLYPKEKFIKAVEDTIRANWAWVPPYGSGASLYVRPVMFGSGEMIGVAPAPEYQFRVFTTPGGAVLQERHQADPADGQRLRPGRPARHGPHQGGPELRHEPVRRHAGPQPGL